MPTEKRIERMVEVSRLYYEKDMTQSEIAGQLGISRPLVSILLSEARACGIVTIQIHDVENEEQLAVRKLERKFPGCRVAAVSGQASSDRTDDAVAKAAYRLCFEDFSEKRNIGVGWGSMLSRIAEYTEPGQKRSGAEESSLFPLVGGIRASYRGYHTNEITRMISEKSGMEASYLYFPAFFDSRDDLDYIRHMEEYKNVCARWDRMDTALINVSNFPSYPDLGVEYRYGNTLVQNGAVGRILAHYYNEAGVIIEPKVDNVVQATVEQLRNTKNVIAVCSSLLRPESVVGVLHTGLVNTIVLSVGLAEKTLELLEKEI